MTLIQEALLIIISMKLYDSQPEFVANNQFSRCLSYRIVRTAQYGSYT